MHIYIYIYTVDIRLKLRPKFEIYWYFFNLTIFYLIRILYYLRCVCLGLYTYRAHTYELFTTLSIPRQMSVNIMWAFRIYYQK